MGDFWECYEMRHHIWDGDGRIVLSGWQGSMDS